MSAARQRFAARFPTTRWSLVDLVGRGDLEATRAALEELLACYLPAMQAHLIHGRGLKPDDSDDLIQEFVADKILEKDLIARADRNLGKFRTFLLTALDRFLIDRLRYAGAKKRTPDGAEPMTSDDQDQRLRSVPSPSDVFDVTWARGVLAATMQRMCAQCDASGRQDVWGVFQCRLVDPILHGTEPADYQQLAERFALQSPAAASNLLITAKRMYARVLRGVVAEYAHDDGEIESELEELRQILARSGT